ncbi:MAG: tRNA uridine-5-carboxymethylaminomethyl(34) synthesis GTPase MnmE [Bdellovibrionota bacterium]
MSSAYFNSETIAAIVTAPNAMAGLGVIRVSGEGTWAAVSPLLRGSFSPEKIESHKLIRCTLQDTGGAALDDGMFVWMKAPRSFTGEEVIELHLHGSPLVLRRVMQALQNNGAREALPGEFSFRAFRNGKLTLDQAESVADLIASRSEEGARRALNHLLGRPREEIAALKKELVDRLAEVEIDIDFSDQGLSLFSHEKWAARLDAWIAKVEKIRAEFVRSQPLRDGIRLAFLGDPNSGKSSLFNRLLGEDRSIVSHEAGTTRDVVRESIAVGGLLFRLSDTAGIRDTQNEIEAKGIERSLGEASSAHLILWVFDGARFQGGEAELEKVRSRLGDAKIIAVWNKSDLAGPPPGAWRAYFEERKIPYVSASALNGQGISALLEAVTVLFRLEADSKPDFWISRTRHYEVLGKAVKSVGEAVAKVRAGEHFPDLLAADLRAALFRIGEITGEFTSDDLLNHIFAEFCIGK